MAVLALGVPDRLSACLRALETRHGPLWAMVKPRWTRREW